MSMSRMWGAKAAREGRGKELEENGFGVVL